MADNDLVALVTSRPGWSVAEDGPATYAPGGDWSTLVRRLAARTGGPVGGAWHIAYQRRGVARHTRIEVTAAEAVAAAERLPAI